MCIICRATNSAKRIPKRNVSLCHLHAVNPVPAVAAQFHIIGSDTFPVKSGTGHRGDRHYIWDGVPALLDRNSEIHTLAPQALAELRR